MSAISAVGPSATSEECCLAGIAAQVMFDASVEDDQLRFAVFHSAEMLRALEKEYDARWHGEMQE